MFLTHDEQLQFGDLPIRTKRWTPPSLKEICAKRWANTFRDERGLEALRGRVPNDVWILLRLAAYRLRD